MAEGRFYLAVLALSSLGAVCVLFTIYWMWSWHGGFAWDGSTLTFNCHPVLMVAGMVVVYSAASLVYRLPQSWVGPKLPWKIAHASLHLLAFLLTVLGLVAVFRYHNSKGIANLYSLHSWLGITTVFFFACQWLLGFAVFLLPWASLRLRGLLKPVHVFFGASILALAMASVISGINEKLFFSLPCCVKGSEARRDAGAVGVRLDSLRTSAAPGAPAVCPEPPPRAAYVSWCCGFCTPSWHRLLRSPLYPGPPALAAHTPAPQLSRLPRPSGGGGKSQQLRWPDSSASVT